MRWPMMMFSFNPKRSSRAPRIAASVNTRVVSWNEAAEMNDCVVRLAFVMPKSKGSLVAGLPSFFTARSLISRNVSLSTCNLAERELVDVLALEELGVARIHHLHFLEHLAHDHADVLVIDLHALEPVHLLHLVQEVLLHGPRALDPQDVVRVHGPLGETVPGAHPVAFVDAQVLAGRHLVQLRLALFGVDIDLALAALDVAEPHGAVHLGHRGRVLGPPRLDQLGHTGETARDVARLVRLA